MNLTINIKINDSNETNWGLAYRLIDDKIVGDADLTLDPQSRTTGFFSGFVQNEFTLIPEVLSSIVAIRLEHNCVSIAGLHDPEGYYFYRLLSIL